MKKLNFGVDRLLCGRREAANEQENATTTTSSDQTKTNIRDLFRQTNILNF